MGHTLDLSDRDRQIADFLTAAGWGGAIRRVLAADASFRRYDRLWLGDATAVLMDAPPPKENIRPFVRVARHLGELGYSAPAILAEDAAAGLLLLEDLGDATFTRLLAAGADEAELYRQAVDLLIDLHHRPAPDDLPPYDREKLLSEAMLLPDWYAEAVGIDLGVEARRDYLAVWEALLPLADFMPATLVLRDFHVDNLMRLDGRSGLARIGLLDFQDAVTGPPVYDLLSLLEDARRDVDVVVRETLRRHYLAAFPRLEADRFAVAWATLAAQRHAKVIGIFTRLCRRDGKPQYLRHLPRVWRLLEQAAGHPQLRPLAAWLDRHLPPDRRLVPAP